jgi:predicted transcriptional regulator
MVTSIQLNNKTKSKLDNLKIFPKESYDDVVKRLINMAEDDEGVLSEQTVKDLEKALDEVKRGKFVSHAEVKRKYGL